METETKLTPHSPGPWEYGENTGYKVRDANDRSICFTHSYHWRSSEECSANARLIAQAPTMAARIVELEFVVRAAITWWESRRPSSMDMAVHIENPTINTYSKPEADLAKGIADYMRKN